MSRNTQPLLDYFEKEFRPKKLHEHSFKAIQEHWVAIRSLEKHLGRTPTLNDLCESTILEWRTELLGRLTAKTLHGRTYALLRIAKHAFNSGCLKTKLDTATFIPRKQRADASAKSLLIAGVTDRKNVEIDSARTYFEIKFLESHIPNVGIATVRQYRCAIQRACDFRGSEVKLEGLCDAFFADFTAWLIQLGFRARRTQIMRRALRAVAAGAQQDGYKIGKVSYVDPLANRGQGNRRHKLKRLGPNKQTRENIPRAAALFATGSTLEEIGKILGVTAHAVHNWRGRYHKLWQSAYRMAITRAAEKLGIEAGENAKLLEATTFSKRAKGVERGLNKQGKSLVKRDTGNPRNCPTLMELVANIAGERALESNTLEGYHHTIRRVEQFMGKTLYADCFSPSWVNKWLAELDGSHLAKATVAGQRRHLLSMWRAAVDGDWCDETLNSKKIRRIKVVKGLVDAWTFDEVNRLVSEAATLVGYQSFHDPITGEKSQVPRCLLWRLIIRVLWDTGLRPGDTKKLRCSAISDEGVIILSQSKTAVPHICKLHRSTMDLIEELRRPTKGKLIPWDKSDNWRSVKFRQLVLEPAELSGEIYKLRKSSASDVEFHFPGMGSVHLGHNLNKDIARSHYLSQDIIAKNRPMPTELTGDLKRRSRPPKKTSVRLLTCG